jgi:hypothetical protein
MLKHAHRLLPLALLTALTLAPAAQASPSQVISDCADDGALNGGPYSNSDLRGALNSLPSDLDEYSDCREVISAAITGGAGGRGSSGSNGGDGASAADLRKEDAARERAARERDRRLLDDLGSRPSLEIGGRPVEPGENGLFDLASAADDLPLPLVLSLAALAILTAAGGAWTLRRRIPALSSIPGPRLPRVRLPRLRR